LYVPIYTKSYLKNKNYSLKFWILIRRHFQRNYQLNDLGRKVWLSFENQKFVSSLFMYLYIHYTVQKILTILKHGPYLKMFKIRFWRTWRTGGERARWITLYICLAIRRYSTILKRHGKCGTLDPFYFRFFPLKNILLPPPSSPPGPTVPGGLQQPRSPVTCGFPLLLFAENAYVTVGRDRQTFLRRHRRRRREDNAIII